MMPHLVKPALLVYVLPHELYGGLGIVLVNQGHVDVIHKIHQALGTRRAVLCACKQLSIDDWQMVNKM